MSRRALSGLVIALLILSSVGAVLKIQPASAEGTIYIRADGSIDPPTANIATTDNVTYTLTGNITSDADGIVIERSNMTLDGAGYTIQRESGFSYHGITLSGRMNVTIKNTRIQSFYRGLYFRSSLNTSIDGNDMTKNYNGISLAICEDTIIIGNNITENRGIGVYLATSSKTTLVDNVFVDNGLLIYQSFLNLVERNTVNNKPLVYLENASDQTINDAGQVILVNCDSVRVENLELSFVSTGLELWNTSNCKIDDNNITSNSQYGIYAWQSMNSSITGNNIANNRLGVWLVSSSGNGIFRNNITFTSYWGVYLITSSGNEFYHNNFINNTYGHVYLDLSLTNSWDNGYPSGGNYWNNYNGTDLHSGPFQNETGNDGIGDTPYITDQNNEDHYPLMAPWQPHDIAVLNVTTSKDGCLPMPIVCQDYTARVNVTVTNRGVFPEVFNVTAYANATVIEKAEVSLAAGNSQMITLIWSTSTFAKGNYSISATAGIAGDETPADNNFGDGMVHVVMIGDVAPTDGYVGIDDIFTTASHFGLEIGHPGYNPNLDITDDGYIGIDDIFIIAQHFGEEDP